MSPEKDLELLSGSWGFFVLVWGFFICLVLGLVGF